jgi:hypothetical protein
MLLSTLLIACGPTGDDSESESDDDTETETDTDITYKEFTSTSDDCADHTGSFYSTDVYDINNSTTFDGELSITSDDSTCTLLSNGIPNHDFNDSNTRSFNTDVIETNYYFEIDRSPAEAASVTELKNGEDEGFMLNGVPISILTSSCWDDDCEWRENPFYGPKLLSIDSNHAHSNTSGEYHYHGNPSDLYDATGATASAVIGYAADGFPIFGPYYLDSASGTIKEATSSYQLQSGNRPGDGTEGSGGPGETYTGEYREDYAYVDGLGTLDECNGMELNGQYAYYVSTTFPYLLSCFKGTPDESFDSRALSSRSLIDQAASTEHVHPH